MSAAVVFLAFPLGKEMIRLTSISRKSGKSQNVVGQGWIISQLVKDSMSYQELVRPRRRIMSLRPGLYGEAISQ